MYSAQQPADSIWRGDKRSTAMLYTDMKACIHEGNYIFFIAVKQVFKIQYFIPAGYRFLYLLIIFLLQPFSSVQAQDETDYAVHANIIYHFTKYVDWPANKKYGDFIIGITGDSPLYEELQKHIANKMAGSQKIIIKKFSASDLSFNCHILFISEDERKSLKKIVSRTTGTSTLLVTESEGFAQRGSCINFSIVSDHLKLEINKNNIEQRRLSIASELLQLGKVVK